MLAVKVVKKIRDRGLELSDADDRLRFRPAGSLSPELKAELKEHKNEILELLANEHPLKCSCQRCSTRTSSYAKIKTTGEVLQLAREVLPELKEEDRVDLDELIQANSPPEPGRDLLAKHETDKARFFGADWREAKPRNFTVHRPDTGGASLTNKTAITWS